MKRLILVRHAKSSWKHLGMADIDRPLSRRGKRDAPRMGTFLAGQDIVPDIILSSPARRARKTVKLLAREMRGAQDRILYDPALYLASADVLMERVRAFDESWQHVMLVGHNPGLTDFANLLTTTGIDNIPTCGVLAIDCSTGSWRDIAAGSGCLVFYVVPKELTP